MVERLEKQEALARLDSGADQPRFLCDLGGELICHALRRDCGVVAAMEGTTSGIRRIASEMGDSPRRFPVLDWNSAALKNLVHNEKMVGFSLWQTFSGVTRLSLHGMTVGVLGYGPVGRGIARTAQGLGARVAVADREPAARKLAEFDGFAALEKVELLSRSRLVVTATGRSGVLSGADLEHLPQGAFLLNAGHGGEEIGQEIRHHPRRRTVLAHVEEISTREGRHCFLLARGELLNLAAGFGDTINGFDLTSAQLVQAVRYLLEKGSETGPYLPPDFLDPIL
jgi:adenosylhomocysteinase